MEIDRIINLNKNSYDEIVYMVESVKDEFILVLETEIKNTTVEEYFLGNCKKLNSTLFKKSKTKAEDFLETNKKYLVIILKYSAQQIENLIDLNCKEKDPNLFGFFTSEDE